MSDLSGSEGPGSVEAPRSDVAMLLDELVVIVERAKSMPLSSSVIISRDEVLDLLRQAVLELPTELNKARRLLQDRDDLHDQALREADEILDNARAQAAHLVERTEVVRQARHQAERITADAESASRRIRHEADDYVDRKLAAFEIVLDRTIRTVQAGRERLRVVPDLPTDSAATDEEALEGLFDQDQT